MPAKSRSQQRLFGMVHAYNKGEFHGSRSLRNRVAALSRHISGADAEHFARTPHGGLPETKEAQAVLGPDQVRALYGYVPSVDCGEIVRRRSERRRTLLGSLVKGGLSGALFGGLGFGALGAFLANRAASGSGVPRDELIRKMTEAGLRMGAWGAGRGACSGAITGAGLYAFDKLNGGDEQ